MPVVVVIEQAQGRHRLELGPHREGGQVVAQRRGAMVPPVGHRGHKARDLDRRGEHESLADRRVQRIAGVPRLLPHPKLPVGIGDDPRAFLDEIDPRGLPQAVHLGVPGQGVGAHGAGQGPEHHVARLGDPLEEVQAAVCFVVVKDTVAEGVEAGTEEPGARLDQPQLQGRGRRDDLEDRPHRIPALGGPVEQRLQRVTQQPRPGRGGDPGREEVGVERGMAGKGHDRAIIGIHRHDGSDPRPESVLGRLLDVQVDPERHGVAGGRRNLPQHAKRAPLGVHLGLDLPVAPLEVTVVDPLDPVLPDQLAGFVALPAQRRERPVVDLSQVSQEVRGQGAVEVIADGLHLHEDAGEIHPVFLERRDGFLGDVAAQEDWIEWSLLGGGGQFVAHLRRGHAEFAGHFGDDLRRIAQLGGQEIDGEGGAVQDQGAAVTVFDQPAGSDDAGDADPILLGEPEEVLPLEDLDLPEADRQRQQQAADDHQHRGQAAFKEISVHRGSGGRPLAGLFMKPNERPVEGAKSMINWDRNEAIIARRHEIDPDDLEEGASEQADQVRRQGPYPYPEAGERRGAHRRHPHAFYIDDPSPQAGDESHHLIGQHPEPQRHARDDILEEPDPRAHEGSFF